MRTDSRVRASALAIAFGLLANACGVPNQGVLDATTAIQTQIELAKASLTGCKAGDAAQCDRTDHNIDNIAETNQNLQALAR